MDSDALKLREIILNTRTPLVFKGLQEPWACFNKTLEEWCKNLDESSRPELCIFEKMSKKHWHEPQWERYRIEQQMTCREFLKRCANDEDDCWYGLNYKRAKQIPELCKEGISFKKLGFEYVDDDASFWLSSAGANTPCHYDTYGCNVVRQVYGRKSWLLLPPDAPLTKTRIPYEESSVYCLENFYSPPLGNIDGMMRFKDYIYHCILEPNDVLIVPRHWWHYVESVETSFSVNAWIPLKCDVEMQIDECIVKFIIERFASCESNEMKKCLLNPNQLNEVLKDNELFAILRYLIDSRKELSPSKLNRESFSYQYLHDNVIRNMINDFPSLTTVPRLPHAEYETLLKLCSKRYDSQLIQNNEEKNFIKEALINSICCPDVIKLIRTKFLELNGK